jgi:gluconolactonase
VDRRAFLTASAVAATATAIKPAAAAESEERCGGTSVTLRHPDIQIESLDGRFKGATGEDAVELVATYFGWAEGPAYFSAGRYLVFSDIPNNRMMRLLNDDKHLSVFRQPL